MFIKKILISLSLVFIFLFLFSNKVFAATCTNNNYNNYSVCTESVSPSSLGVTWLDYSTYGTAFNNIIPYIQDDFPNDTFSFSDFKYTAVAQYYRYDNNENNYSLIFSTCPVLFDSWNSGAQGNVAGYNISCRSLIYNRVSNSQSDNRNIKYYYNVNNIILKNISNTTFFLQQNTILNSYRRLYYSSNNNISYNFNTIPNASLNNIHEIESNPLINDIYNPNLLDNNDNFTKVCVNNQNSYFSIIPNNIDTSADFSVTDFMLLNKFLSSAGHTTLSLNDLQSNIATNGTNTENWYYNLWSPDYMAFIYNTADIGAFRHKYNFYEDMYGWSIYPNTFRYIAAADLFDISVYILQNTYTYSVDCVPQQLGGSTVCIHDDSMHGGGGRDHYDNIDTITENTCFYIPSNYYLKIWNVNEYGDISDTFTVNDTNYNINTEDFMNKYISDINNNTYSGYVGYFKTLIDICSVPLNFISNKITLFFNSMPQLLQYVILTFVFVGLVVGLIKFLTGGK